VIDVLLPFRHPAALFLLLVPVALLIWIWRRRGGEVVLPIDHGATPRGTWLRVLLGLAESLPALLLAVCVLILAGPQRWAEPRSQKKLTNIEFCVDVSGSMAAQFGDGTRYDASMKAINGFLDYREGDAFGLTFFGNAVLHWVPLTTDVSAFRCAPPFMRPGRLPRWFGGTEIGKALSECRKVLNARTTGDKMIILVSDGMSADLYGGRDEEIAAELRADGIAAYAIHISSSSAPAEIVNLTARTGGEIFEPGDPAGLDAVFRRIDEMHQAQIESVRAEAIDHFEPFSLAALALLGAAVLAWFGLRATPW
jgi:Ca-activated chloride channel family protein